MPNQFTHPWSKDEISFISKNIKKLTYKQMSIVLQRSPSSIQSKIRYLPYNQKVKKHPVNSDFFKLWSPEMAYVLGFIAADGNICHSGSAHTLHIASDDVDIIEKIKIVLEYKGPIYKKPRSNGKISYSLRICDPVIFQSLNNLNITERKSLTLKPPKIPKYLIRHFIRGYFDGDGSVSLRSPKYNNKLVVDIYTASIHMAAFLHQNVTKVLDGLYKGNIKLTLAHQKTQYYAVRLGHGASQKLFQYMYKNANIYLERKYQKFMEGV